ncbi:MAG TPA: glycosyltransferase family 4 protein [Planctomycetota bacterium]|nr:glycosyltransferase family 4 protein [Planctomycetota bacterium]
MKLAFWLSTLEASGGAKVFLEHARRLEARGHEVTVARGKDARPPGGNLVVTRYRDVEPALAVSDRVIHLVQGLDVPEGNVFARWRKRARVRRALAARTRKVVVSRHLQEKFEGSLLAPTGIDLEVFRPGEPARSRRVLVAGQGPTKGIDLAFAVLAQVPGIEVVHLALRPEDTASHAHVRASSLGEAETAALIRSAAVYLSTVSAEEGFDLVALEAMASGTACVLSGGGAHHELAPDLVSGFDPGALTRDLTRALDDPAERTRRVERGLAVARERSWDRVIERVEAAYAAALRS